MPECHGNVVSTKNALHFVYESRNKQAGTKRMLTKIGKPAASRIYALCCQESAAGSLLVNRQDESKKAQDN